MGGKYFHSTIDRFFGLASGRQVRYALSMASTTTSNGMPEGGEWGEMPPLSLVEGGEDEDQKPFGDEEVDIDDFEHEVGRWVGLVCMLGLSVGWLSNRSVGRLVGLISLSHFLPTQS